MLWPLVQSRLTLINGNCVGPREIIEVHLRFNTLRHRTPTPPSLLEDATTTVELLEAFVADRGLLNHLPADLRERLHRAVAVVHNPDKTELRRKFKAAERERSALQIQRAEDLLHQT